MIVRGAVAVRLAPSADGCSACFRHCSLKLSVADHRAPCLGVLIRQLYRSIDRRAAVLAYCVFLSTLHCCAARCASLRCCECRRVDRWAAVSARPRALGGSSRRRAFHHGRFYHSRIRPCRRTCWCRGSRCERIPGHFCGGMLARAVELALPYGSRLAGFLPRVCFLGWSVAGFRAPPSLAALYRSWNR